jgi:hypothetical protein
MVSLFRSGSSCGTHVRGSEVAAAGGVEGPALEKLQVEAGRAVEDRPVPGELINFGLLESGDPDAD